MSNEAILIPLFAQMALIAGLMLWMAVLRVHAVRRGEARPRDIALDSSGWPEKARKVGNCVNNQFQLPVLFLVLCALLIAARHVDTLQVWLAWLFVASRFAHAWIHTGTNNPVTRFYAFITGFAALAAMWIHFGIAVFSRSG